MNYGEIILNDTANGEGIRLSLFVSGCNHHCKGCFQPETWNPDYGKRFTKDTLDYLITELQKPQYSGLTLLGGDPLYSSNRITVNHIIATVRKLCPNKTIWLYTGDLYEDLQKEAQNDFILKSILNDIDVLVDGPFIEEKKDIRLKFRGSSNQRIFDLKN